MYYSMYLIFLETLTFQLFHCVGVFLCGEYSQCSYKNKITDPTNYDLPISDQLVLGCHRRDSISMGTLIGNQRELVET